MENRERWNALSKEEQLAHREQRRLNKQKAKELSMKPDDELTEEEKKFIAENRAIPGNQRKRMKRKKGPRDDSWKEKYTNDRERFLSIACKRFNCADKIVCIDVEKFMYNDRITEVGVTVLENGKIQPLHYIIKENYNYRNKKIVKCGGGVEDNKDGFTLSESIHISIEELPEILTKHTSEALVIGHAFQNDIDFLKNHFTFDLTRIMDTQHVAKYFYKTHTTIGLKTLLSDFEIAYEGLHNAGNDAYYTLKIMMHMLENKENKEEEKEEMTNV